MHKIFFNPNKGTQCLVCINRTILKLNQTLNFYKIRLGTNKLTRATGKIYTTQHPKAVARSKRTQAHSHDTNPTAIPQMHFSRCTAANSKRHLTTSLWRNEIGINWTNRNGQGSRTIPAATFSRFQPPTADRFGELRPRSIIIFLLSDRPTVIGPRPRPSICLRTRVYQTWFRNCAAVSGKG